MIGGADLINGTNATLTTDRFYNSNSSLYLNDGYYSLPIGVYLNGDFTVSLWIRVIKVKKYARIIEFSNAKNSDRMFVSYSNGLTCKPYIRIFPSPEVFSSTSLIVGKWEFVIIVLYNSILRVYINSNLVGENLNSTRPKKVIRTINSLGNSLFVANDFPNAEFDEIKIYNRALTQAEITQNMNHL